MTIEELINLQKKFDSCYTSNFDWDLRITENNLEMLEFLVLSLTGELGETANIIKKIIRGDYKLNEKKEEIADELADMLIYIVKIAYQMDIDLIDSYLNKYSRNMERFKHYEREPR